MRYLSVEEILKIHDIQIKRFGGDISFNSDKVYNCIETAVNLPRQTVFGEELYPSLADKASAYLFFLTKKHCFSDGNKRTALHSTLLFLKLNGWELDKYRATPKLAAKLTLDIASNKCTKDQVTKWFWRRIVLKVR